MCPMSHICTFSSWNVNANIPSLAVRDAFPCSILPQPGNSWWDRET
jgi:hypothetical protein